MPTGDNSFAKLPAADMERARHYALTARMLLRDAYALVEKHTTLRIQADTAGKCVKQLAEAIEARQTEWGKS